MSGRLKKDDYFEAGQPAHRLSYCAFLDVLGFSARICKSYETGEGDKLLRQFHAIFDKRLKELTANSSETMLYVKAFSDNVLLAHPQFSDDMESEFAFVLWALTEYQLDMALNGFFIRGGFAIGQLFVDSNSVYGGALIDAYNLENKVAVHPVVVLSDDVMRLVDKHNRYYSYEPSPQQIDVLVKEDGRYFINYLSECIDEDDFSVNATALLRHKENIESSLATYKDDARVRSKFTWLAAYHNFFCKSVAEHGRYSDKLLITGDIEKVKLSHIKKKRRS